MKLLRMLSHLVPHGLSAAPPGGGTERFVAVAALSLDGFAEISMQAAHAPNFLLFDDRGALREVVPNPYLTLHDDAAHRVADLLAAKGVRLFIAGQFGPVLGEALEAKGIHHIKDVGLANIAVACHREA